MFLCVGCVVLLLKTAECVTPDDAHSQHVIKLWSSVPEIKMTWLRSLAEFHTDKAPKGWSAKIGELSAKEKEKLWPHVVMCSSCEGWMTKRLFNARGCFFRAIFWKPDRCACTSQTFVLTQKPSGFSIFHSPPRSEDRVQTKEEELAHLLIIYLSSDLKLTTLILFLN